MNLRVHGLQKVFHQGETVIPALSDISFALNEGETLAVVGPSGSGKTTLLSLLAGLESASSGTIAFGEHQLDKMTESELSDFRARHIGIVFQQFHLMPHLTALENVTLPLDIQGVDNSQPRAREALERVGLGARLRHLPSQLSGGECQRVAIARASVVKPKLLLADEPSGNLDTATGVKIIDLLFSLVAENHTTLILVTHDLQLARRCSRQLSIAGGRIQ